MPALNHCSASSDRLAGLFAAEELQGLRSIALVVLDSLRWDSFVAARTPILDELAPRQHRRSSYATWTMPSHSCILAGLLPFQMIEGRAAAETYRDDGLLWAHALAGSGAAASRLVPTFSLAMLARRCGWQTIGRVAVPVLNPHTPFSRGFDDYVLCAPSDKLADQVASLPAFEGAARRFVFVNAGDTHYPYGLAPDSVPHVAGIRGALLHAGDVRGNPPDPADPADMERFRAAQIAAARDADAVLAGLVERLPKPLMLVVCSDHGELFGEDGCFGHGPYSHPALFDVPVAAGLVG